MRDINQTIIIGRLTNDVSIAYTGTGTPYAKFSIANNRDFGEKKKVNFIDVEVWGKIAEICNQYLKKGSQIAAIGELDQQRWQDKTSGKTRSKIVIKADLVQFLDKADSNPTGQASGLSNGYEQDDPWNS